jgi:hypothetical protein
MIIEDRRPPAKGGSVLKKVLICLLIATAGLTLPGCSIITGEGIGGTADKEAPVTTELGQMLASVPDSFLGKYDIFFGNLDQVKELSGVEDLNTSEAILEALKELPLEQYKQFGYDFSAAAASFLHLSHTEQLAPLIGFDVFSFDRIAVINNIPPRVSCIAEGNFDEELISTKLTEQGYTKTDYGDYSYYNYYYAIRDDYDIDLMNPLSRIVLAAFNRVAVLDDLIVISPATEEVTNVLDTMTGTVPSIMDNAVCRALADSLGDPLAAVMTTPERIITSIQDAENKPKFDFAIPGGWRQLHTYEMAALGYRAEGDRRFVDIALYYTDKAAAEADGKEIVSRMSSYTLNTWTENADKSAFLDLFQPGEPAVTQYPDGAVLKISCQLIPKAPMWTAMILGGEGLPIRDLLFLALDPSVYLGKNK